MGKYTGFKANNETEVLIHTPVEDNSYNFEEISNTFKGRSASSLEKKQYNIQKGVKNADVSIYVYSTNMPEDIKPNDKVMFLGKIWTVETTGYYLDQSRIIDFSVFDPEYIKAVSPKGMTLK